MNKQDGGPAFPSQFFDERAMGMTLRDYFAAEAMQEWVGVLDPDEGTLLAYKWADAMLKAREQ